MFSRGEKNILSHCPECSHEISDSAIACPNCGRPISAPTPVEEKRVYVPAPVADREFPPWAIVPIVVGVLIVGGLLYLLVRGNDDQTSVNVNANMAGRRPVSTGPPSRVAVPSTESAPVTIPGSQASVPAVPSVPETRTSIPGMTTAAPSAPPARGTVALKATVVRASGAPQSARNARFYLLDKDLEAILSEARIDPIEGNTLSGSLGLAAVFPDRYGDFQRAAMRAINGHVKYTGTTGGAGTASLGDIIPNEYYLFAITRIGHGFALWSSPVSVNPGQNIIDLSPQPVTDIPNGDD